MEEKILKLRGKVITEIDVELMTFEEIKEVYNECQFSIEEIRSKKTLFMAEHEKDKSTNSYRKKLTTYNFAITRYHSALNWIKPIMQRKAGPENDRRQLYYHFYKTAESRLWKPIFKWLYKESLRIKDKCSS